MTREFSITITLGASRKRSAVNALSQPRKRLPALLTLCSHALLTSSHSTGARLKSVRWTTWLALAVLAIVAIALRLWELDRRSLWFDEIVQSTCSSKTLGGVLDCVRANHDQTPLAYLVTHFVYRLAGSPPLPNPSWFVRLPEVFAGTATVLMAGLLARELLGGRGGWLCALLWAISPLAVGYSQEARMYAWLTLFSASSALCMVTGLRRPSVLAWLGFGVTTTLNLYSHYVALLVLGSEVAFISAWLGAQAIRTWRESTESHLAAAIRAVTWQTLGSFAGLGLALLAVLPWVPDFFHFLDYLNTEGRTLEVFAKIPLSPDSLSSLLKWLLLYVPQATVLPEHWEEFMILVLMLGLIWMAMHKRLALVFCLIWTAIPFAYFAVTQGLPLTFRYLIYLAVGCYMLLVAGILALGDALASVLTRFHRKSDIWRTAASYAPSALFVLMLPGLFAFYNIGHDDWRSTAAYLRNHARPGDTLFVLDNMDHLAYDALGYYRGTKQGRLSWLNMTYLNGAAAARLKEAKGRVWGILLNRGPTTIGDLQQWSGDEFTLLNFSNVSLVETNSPLNKKSQAEQLARLIVDYSALHSDKTVAAIQLLQPEWLKGKNLIFNPSFGQMSRELPLGWDFSGTPGQVVKPDGKPALLLTNTTVNAPIDATQIVQLEPGHTYLFQFQCRNDLKAGEERAYVTLNRADGEFLTFPRSAGYVCPSGSAWQLGAIGFQVPRQGIASSAATIWLRNYGTGQALFRDLHLTEIRDQ